VFTQVGYQPHAAQWPVHQSDAQVLLIAGGERSGKSRSGAAEVLARSPWCYRANRVALVAREYDETKAECEYLLADFEKLKWLSGQSLPRQGKWQWS
jgi:phage terminase large subunit-like protein